ncbi:NADH:flavin oxidoreductase [Roseovarius sp. TE539]|uniref:oxidoreductase n=1 Tax=Roseovarius sp. TE539 TaxID=2249812 RepID=UPI000DDD98CD|nr:FAD-dependent oxidoreductase [Roseovarius sp. TE539]RBI70332.1 NADH:flavin oxidoreductase [Roseovarius sp. TE539]
MTRDTRYDCLFEPVQIGPVTARNRFYQVPHCNGMGRVYPSTMAEMRRTKAEGGWAVICTEEVEIHSSSEHAPWSGGRLWDDRDMPVLARMCDGIHEFGSLAGVELNHAGLMAANRYSRDVPMAPSHCPVALPDPVQARAMDKSDIRDLRRWHREAALRARRTGFDIVYVYAGHQLSTISHFLSRRHNHRSDEYGGSLENRARLLCEVLEDTREAVGERCAVALRFAVEELLGSGGMTSEGEGRDLVEMLAELPDLWDVNLSGWENDSATSRFKPQGFQDDYVAFVKTVTSKPVVGVGRYTSPDAMVSLVKGGKLDFIGAARPSIADPFLPAKIEEGRIDEIRECIGCNICVSGDNDSVPIRCTQNPTMGEEWRRGWHPERIAPRTANESFLIVGAGPAGLECALALGQRGYAVTLAEAGSEPGGRVARERRLPGLSEWGRVADYREYRIGQMVNVDFYLESRMDARSIAEFGADHVVLATGARWSADGKGRENPAGMEIAADARVLTPDDIMDGTPPPGGQLIVFDDDHYYMGAVIAEKLRRCGADVTYVTPATEVSSWTHNTLEQHAIQKRLLDLGVRIRTARNIAALRTGAADLECIYTGQVETLSCGAAVLVTMRRPVDDLYADLSGDGPGSLTRIGDCLAPGTIAAAVYGGHRFAREVGAPVDGNVPFRRECMALAGTM